VEKLDIDRLSLKVRLERKKEENSEKEGEEEEENRCGKHLKEIIIREEEVKYKEKIEPLEQVVGKRNWIKEEGWIWSIKEVDGALEKKRSRIRSKKIEFKMRW